MALLLNLAPAPLIETQLALVSARAIMAATELGVFSCLSRAPVRRPAKLRKQCQLDPRATEALLGALVSCGYLRYRRERFELTPKSRKWLAEQQTWSLFDYMPHVRDVWEMMSGLEGSCARARRSISTPASPMARGHGINGPCAPWPPSAPRKSPSGYRALPRPGACSISAAAHGFYAVALCRKHPQLSATILDLPEAIDHAAPILAGEAMGDRIQHRAGDALADDFGEGAYDLILISNLVHHFSDQPEPRPGGAGGACAGSGRHAGDPGSDPPAVAQQRRSGRPGSEPVLRANQHFGHLGGDRDPGVAARGETHGAASRVAALGSRSGPSRGR